MIKSFGIIFNWKTFSGQNAYKRYFSKFDAFTNVETAKHFFSWFFKNIYLDHFTLDIDSTVMPRYRKQQEGTKRGLESHYFIITFVNDINMVANIWLRSGDASSANNFISFLEDTLYVLGDKKVDLIHLA